MHIVTRCRGEINAQISVYIEEQSWASAGEAVERSAFVTRSKKHIHDPPLVLWYLGEKKEKSVRKINTKNARRTLLQRQFGALCICASLMPHTWELQSIFPPE